MNPLKSLHFTLVLGFVLALVIALVGEIGIQTDIQFNAWSFAVWLHVFFGVIWIGLLYYFNFVQVPAVASATADTDGPGPQAINKYVAPRALWWFRWAALLTWLTGAAAIHAMQYSVVDTFLFLEEDMRVMSIGAWLGTIMLFNVWVLIWPNQKKVLGIVPAEQAEKDRAKFIALMASRSNTLLSIPMLMCMVGQGHGLFL